MNILRPVINPFFDLSWVISAFRETVLQPTLKRKLKHLKYRLLWELRPLLKWAGNIPLAVDVELSSYCNFRCIFCQQASNWWNKTGMKVEESHMSWEIFTRVVDECSEMGVYSMKINWRGEPMANPHFQECIRYMKQKGIHEVMMNTNASYITEENVDALILSGIDRIIFSCDGISKETYNRIRKGGDWDGFIKKIRLFSSRIKFFKGILGSDYKSCRLIPKSRINTAVMEENYHEIPQFREIFSSLVDELRFNTLYNPQSRNKFLGSRRRIEKRKGCPQIYQRMIVSHDGDVVPCCADYEKKLNLGNLSKLSLRSMYRGEMGAVRKIHEMNRARRFLHGCRNCDLFLLSEIENGKISWKGPAAPIPESRIEENAASIS